MGGGFQDLQAAFRLRPTGIEGRIGCGSGFGSTHFSRGQTQHRGLGQCRRGSLGLGGDGFKHAVDLIEFRRISERVGGLLGEVVLGLRRLDLRQGHQHGAPGVGVHRLDERDDRLGPGGVGGLGCVGSSHQQRHGLGRDFFRLRQLSRHRRQQAGFRSGSGQKGFEGVTRGNAMAGQFAPDQGRLTGFSAV